MNEHSDLWKLVYNSKYGDKRAVEKLYYMFLPLLKKYSQKIGEEDALSELTLNFLQMLRKIPIENDNFKEDDKYILSYINTSVKNSYIQLNSQKERYLNNNIFVLDDDEYVGECKKINVEFVTISLICGEIERLLSRNDYQIVMMKYAEGRTEEDIAKMYGVSKQAINKRLKKSREIIKGLYN